MPATPIATTVRFIRPGVTKIYWVTTMANYRTPTRAELDAGMDLSDEVASLEGFATTSESADAPDMGSRFTSKVPGMITADDSTITLYMSRTGGDIREQIERDSTGYVVIMDTGDVTGELMDVFPATVSAMPKNRSLEDVATVAINFTITNEPAENVVIPATV